MYEFIGNCISLDGEEIFDMVQEAEEVDADVVYDLIDDQELLKNLFPTYCWDMEDELNLKMEDDYAASFYISTYKKEPCVFISWSSIEYVWIEKE